MRVLITGAAGFVGQAVLQALQRAGSIGGRRIAQVAQADRVLGEVPAGQLAIAGDLADVATLTRIADFAPDVTFHLAAVPGGASEADYTLGRRVNLEASLALFETLASLGTRPVVVYASTIAVYGTALPDPVTPLTPLRPPLTYGAHKQACEILLADFSRRGKLDARSVRLPGIVARPSSSAGLTSAFMSELLHALKAGRPFTCPVGPQATAWWMSVERCADNLLHAAAMDLAGADPGRAWPLPVLRLSMQEVIAAAAALWGDDRRTLVSFAPVEHVEAVFGRYPRLDDADARALGLRDDGDARQLVLRALGDVMHAP